MEENRYKCYLCGNEITSLNKTDEHIILNAIGGRLRSSTIICNDCNNKMGETSGSILAEDLSFFSDMLQIKRERSSSHNQIMIDEEGDEVIVDDAGLKFNLRKPSIKIKEIDGEKKMRIVAKNEQQIKGMLNRAVKEGNINQDQADSAFSKAKKENYRPILKKEIFISNGAFPSIIKSAVNFYVDRTHDMETIEHLVPVIKGEKRTEGVIYLYIFKMLPYSTCDKQVTHMIHIEGSKSTRFLYALMEYFSVYTYIVILHDDYEGENINMTYTYDVISNKEVNRKFSCPLKKGDIDTLNQFHMISIAKSISLNIENELTRLWKFGKNDVVLMNFKNF